MIRIIVNSHRVTATLKRLTNGLTFTQRPLRESAEIIEENLKTRFPLGKDVDGQNYKPLTQTTLRIKKAKGYGNKPILERTGRMKNSTRIIEAKERQATIINDTPYAVEHQKGKKKLPMRKFFGITKEAFEKITKVWTDYIKQILR